MRSQKNIGTTVLLRFWANMKKHHYCILLITTTILVSNLSLAGNSQINGDDCLTCHDNMYSKTLYKLYIHDAFVNKKCLVCHVENNYPFFSRKTMENSLKNKGIEWLTGHHEADSTHFFMIQAEEVNDSIYVKTMGEDQQYEIAEIKVPPIEQLMERFDDNRKPTIFGIRFLGVQKGVLHKATVSWNTDKPTEAQIQFGKGKLDQKTRLSSQLKKNHVLVLSPLLPKTNYVYRIMARDIYGNEAVSQIMSFSTTEVVTKMAFDIFKNKRGTEPLQSGFQHVIERVGNSYLIKITTNEPTYMHIGRIRNFVSKINKSNGKKIPPQGHTALKNSVETSIKVCLNCHQNYGSGASHPINVRPKRGMVFPKDYPILDNGKMHCITCHEPHGSNNEARIRRSTKQELCLGCHRDYG